jgi:hypothetical protein
MIDAQVCLRGVGSEAQKLPSVPAVGDYLRHGAGAERRLWQVDGVVFDADVVTVYCVQVSAMLAEELTTRWATWNEPTSQDCESCVPSASDDPEHVSDDDATDEA